MAFDEGLAERIRGVLDARSDVDERKMFGGIAFLVGGNMACGVMRDDLMVRMEPDAAAALESEPGIRRFDMGGRPMKAGCSWSPRPPRTTPTSSAGSGAARSSPPACRRSDGRRPR
jgi:hypothetical protein